MYKKIMLTAVAAATAHAASAAPTFRIDSLTANNATAIEVNGTTGDDRGGIAVSGSRVFLTGDSATGVYNKNLTSGVSATQRDGIFMNVRDQSVWTLATSATTPYNNFYLGGTITHIIQLDPITGATMGTAIALSSPVTISANSFVGGIFSGYDRVLYRNAAGAVSKIDITTGAVTNLGNVATSMAGSENYAAWGVAEIFGGEEYLTYGQGSNYPVQNIVRTRISDGVTSTVASFTSLSDLANFAVSPTDGRWYFHYEGGGQFGGRDETLGFADATYTILSDTAAVPEPATWAMMIAGFGLVGGAMRRRQTTAVTFA